MVKLLYSLLLVGTSGGVGLALVVGWLNYKLYRLDRQAYRKSQGLLYVAVLVQNAILVWRLIEVGTTELSFASVLYVLGLALATVALGWRAAGLVKELALIEAVHNGHSGGTQLWLQNVERRLVAEEARNTAIEERADVSEKRADAAEKREGEAE
jgi:hypothetical protein